MRQRFGIRTRLILVVIPVVLVLIISFFALSKNMIEKLAKENLVSESQVYAGNIGTWASNILSEIKVYQDAINEGVFKDDKEILHFMEASVESNEAYPIGLYMGDDAGVYLDASGWIPGDDWVLVERDWYLEGKEHAELAFGEPYYDSQSGQVCVSASVRMNYDKAVRVLAVDVYLDYVAGLMKEIQIGKSGKAFLVTKSTQTVIAHPEESMMDVKLSDSGLDSIYANTSAAMKSGKTGLIEAKGDAGQYFVCINDIEDTDWCLVTYISKREVLSDLHWLELCMLMIAIVAGVVLIVLILRMMNRVVKPVQQVTDVLSEVAAGDFSQNIEVGSDRNDEIAQMSSSMQMFLEKMRGIISDISGTAEWLNRQSQENGMVSDTLLESADHQANAMTEMGNMVEELSKTANEVSAEMASLADVIHSARSEGNHAGTIMQDTVEASRQGQRAMQDIKTSMRDIETTITSLAEQIRHTEESIGQISNMVNLIMDIAEETNLLSLNASIEAARAGEAGQGFAVVAEQIGKLAENSGSAADDISGLTQNIRETVTQATAHMEQSVAEVKESAVMIESASQTFGDVFAKVGETDAIVRNMVTLVGQVDKMASEMMRASESQLSVAEEITKSTTLLGEYTKTVTDNSDTVAKSAKALEEQSSALSESMNQFTV